MTPGELIGDRLKEIRTQRGLSQHQFGEALEPLLGNAWSRQAVSNLEKGRRAVTATELVAFCLVLECAMIDLFSPRWIALEVELPGKTIAARDFVKAMVGPKADEGAELQGLAQGLHWIVDEFSTKSAEHLEGLDKDLGRLAQAIRSHADSIRLVASESEEEDG